MTSNLSPSAIQRIIFLVVNDDRPTCTRAGFRPIPRRLVGRKTFAGICSIAQVLQQVNNKWRAIYELYRNIRPAPPLAYLDSLELALVLKGELDNEDVRGIFAHGKPLEFWGCPRLLVSKIIEAFTELQKEPEFLDVTITALFGLGAVSPSETWPQVYTATPQVYLPCYACTAVESVEERSIPRQRYRQLEDPVGTVDFAVEKFHVTSERFVKQITVELHYQLEEGTSEGEREQSSLVHKIAIRLTNESCSAKARLPSTTNRSSATLLLLPDFASELFGFLDRAHIGSSLLANRALHTRICQLKQRLPVHHLRCRFDRESLSRGFIQRLTGAYWLEIRHFQRDLSYTDVRRFKVPSSAGAENDCALIRHYLSNSYVVDLRVPQYDDLSSAIKMLASLETRNFSVGRVELCSEAQRMSDYRSMDAVFGKLRITSLHMSCNEHRFLELVKTTDFFRMPTVQGLRELKLNLSHPWDEDEPRRRDRSKSPLWVSGICLLLNCKYYRVKYGTDRHLQSIKRKMVRICEEFERGNITDIVEHFHFKSDSEDGMNYAFSRDNLLVSGMKVKRTIQRYPFTDIEWDVYRFRNAGMSEYLTACVGRTFSHPVEHILHLVRGEAYPDASFADYVDP